MATIEEINAKFSTADSVEPCPLCGSKPFARVVVWTDGTPGKLGIVNCCDLIAMTYLQPDIPSFSMFVRAWNKKARAVKWLLLRAKLSEAEVDYFSSLFRRRY